MNRNERDRERRDRASGSSASGATSSASASNPSAVNVESTVTRLLVAIKQLLEALTQWSKGQMTELEVSDVYVRLGNDFNSAVAAFVANRIDMSDLLSIPDDLRAILEQALSEEATPENLENYLPHVREVITKLLQGLRTRQSVYRRSNADRQDRRHNRSDTGSTTSTRHDRMDSISSRTGERGSRNLPSEPQRYSSTSRGSTLPEDDSGQPRRPSGRSSSSNRRKESVRPQPSPQEPVPDTRWVGGFGAQPPPTFPQQQQPPAQQSSRISANAALPDLVADAAAAEQMLAAHSLATAQPTSPSFPQENPAPAPTRRTSAEEVDRTTPTRTSMPRIVSGEVPPGSPPPSQPPMPVVSPDVKRYSLTDKPVSPPSVVIDASSPVVGSEPQSAIMSDIAPSPSTSPRPQSPTTPVIESSLQALKRSEALERRASKRFSTYTFSKMTGGAVGGSSRDKSTQSDRNRRSMATPNGTLTTSDLYALTEESETVPSSKAKKDRPDLARVKSSDSLRRTRSRNAPPVPSLPSEVPRTTVIEEGEEPSNQSSDTLKPPQEGVSEGATTPTAVAGSSTGQRPISGGSTSSPTMLTVFLQHDRKVKKVVIDPPTSFSGVRVLFVDKFMYNPGQDNFPAIYIRDPSSGVQYELEDVSEIHDRCLLSLNVEPLDQLKQSIDNHMSSLSQDIRDLKSAVTSARRMSVPPGTIGMLPAASMEAPAAPRPTDRQFQNVAQKLMRMKSDENNKPQIPTSQSAPLMQPLVAESTGGSTLTYSSDGTSSRIVSDLKVQFDEVQNLRRDLGVLRQLYLDFNIQTKESLSTLRHQTQTVRDLATTKVAGERAYLDSGKSKLDSRSQDILTRVEELQDLVETLKDDVLKRHIMPKGSVMKNLKVDIEKSLADLQSITQHITTVKPMWKRTWETELQNIVEEQQFLTHQEELVSDLIEDHKALTDVFGHVEKVVALRNTTPRLGRRGPSFKAAPVENGEVGFTTVMAEIRGASTDPHKRMKAIEATQKARQREMATRTDELQDELTNFLSGKKLKMTGGAEEAERIRQKKNEMTLKAMFTNGGTPQPGSSPSPPPDPPTI